MTWTIGSESGSDSLSDLMDSQRFHADSRYTKGLRALRIDLGAETRDEDHRQIPTLFLDSLAELHARDRRHGLVCEEEIELPGVFFEQRERLTSIGGCGD